MERCYSYGFMPGICVDPRLELPSTDELLDFAQEFYKDNAALISSAVNKILVSQLYFNGVLKYFNEFMTPYWTALNAFLSMEKKKTTELPLTDTLRDYWELFHFNMQVAEKGMASTFKIMQDFHQQEYLRGVKAWYNTLAGFTGEEIPEFVNRQEHLIEKVIHDYPKAIEEIKTAYGFHFDQQGYVKFDETERFIVYQVLPQPGTGKSKHFKPILIIPPYVLGANILAFLPSEHKSYVHAFANQGIPTYIRILKDIDNTPAVQIMTGEQDAEDTRYFCEKIMARHNLPVTLNGFCQGGFIAVVDLASGVLDGLVDALITCVAPIDGTRSKSIIEYLSHLPKRFRDLGYAIKKLPNGNHVVDGKVMSWVYKLKSMDREAPLYTYYRDIMLFDDPEGKDIKITKTGAALNHWLTYDRKDIPVAITQMSFDSYTVPIRADGTLPVKLFGRELTIKHLADMGIPYLICYGAKDDLVDKEACLAPKDFMDVEITVFPKGHGAIATSWSDPDSEYALHKTFANGMRGPVRFQLDLDEKSQKKAEPHG